MLNSSYVTVSCSISFPCSGSPAKLCCFLAQPQHKLNFFPSPRLYIQTHGRYKVAYTFCLVSLVCSHFACVRNKKYVLEWRIIHERTVLDELGMPSCCSNKTCWLDGRGSRDRGSNVSVRHRVQTEPTIQALFSGVKWWGNSASILVRLRAVRPKFSSGQRQIKFFSLLSRPDRLWGHLSFIYNGYHGFTLFICSLVKDIYRSSDSVVSNDRMIVDEELEWAWNEEVVA
jgi:hypothetical protein